MRVDHEVEEGVDSVELVVGDGSDGLLSHGALIGVSGRLVVVRVGNETGDGSEDGEGFDLEMGGSRDDHVLVESDEGVVLLVTIEVLDDSGSEEVVEGLLSFLEEL